MSVTSFNTRTGDVVLSTSDVTTALLFTPENAINKKTSGLLTASEVLFPVEKVIKDYVDINSIPTASNNSGFII